MIEYFDQYCIHLQIDGQIVIVYRHGVENLEVQFSSVKSDKMMRSEPYICISSTDDIKLAGIKFDQKQVIGLDKDNRKRVINKDRYPRCLCRNNMAIRETSD